MWTLPTLSMPEMRSDDATNGKKPNAARSPGTSALAGGRAGVARAISGSTLLQSVERLACSKATTPSSSRTFAASSELVAVLRSFFALRSATACSVMLSRSPKAWSDPTSRPHGRPSNARSRLSNSLKSKLGSTEVAATMGAGGETH